MPPMSKNLSTLFFLGSFSATAGLVLWWDGGARLIPDRYVQSLQGDALRMPLAPRPLTEQDRNSAQIAWQYFEQNYRPKTGLVDAVAGFPSGTLWDQGSYVLALVAARKLGVISSDNFVDRADSMLSTLALLPLFDGHLPNKVYHTETLEMVNYSNQPVPEGIGWSALDIARLLSALRVLELHHPEYGPRIRTALAAWSLPKMTEQGRLMGAAPVPDGTLLLQEGRLGYEQYGARSAALWGMDVLDAVTAKTNMSWTNVQGVEIPTDLRAADIYEAITPIVSEPFFLQILEMGHTHETAVLADRVYSAQENRYAETGQITLVSEGHIDQAPHFLYNSVYSNGTNWAVIAEDGQLYQDLRTISLKSAFAWDAIYQTPYTQKVLGSLLSTASDKGWPSGIYESNGEVNDIYTANTNAVVLQSLYFKAFGPLMQISN